MSFILGDIHDGGGQYDWLEYEWLKPLTETQEQVEELNKRFKHLNWRFRVGGYKYWGGAQATGLQMKSIILGVVYEKY